MNSNRSLLSALLLAACIQWTQAAQAAVLPGGCLADRATFLGQNCTANDVTFVLVGLGTQTDGCVAPGSATGGDDVEIRLRAIVQNTTAQTRYDIGMWFATDGDPNGDGALTGTCGREMLHPAADPADFGNADCPPLDLTGGAGDFYVGESSAAVADACGDLLDSHAAGVDECDQDMDGIYDDSILDFVTPQTFPCRDVDTNGRLNIPTCASWGNNESQVYMGTCSVTTTQLCQADHDCPGSETCVELGNASLCDSEDELMNGTAAKCACEDTDTDIPRPDLGLSCSCQAPTTVRPGFPVDCTITYTNPSPASLFGINPDLPNYLQAGTAGYVRFFTSNGPDGGEFSGVSATAGTTSVPGSLASITWHPAGGRCDSGILPTTCDGANPAPEANVIGPDETESLSFTYTVDPGASDGAIQLLTTTQWSADAAFTTPVTQPLTTTCDITVDATYALVTDAHAYRDAGGNVVLQWDTASEVATAGFRVRRLDRNKGYFVELGDNWLPAAQHAPGARYRFADTGAPDGDSLEYQIVEYDLKGAHHFHGPYRFDTLAQLPAWRGRELAADKNGGFESEPHAQPASTKRRYEAAAESGFASKAVPSVAGKARVLVTDTGIQFIPVSVIADIMGTTEEWSRRFIDRNLLALSRNGRIVPWYPAADNAGLYFYGEAPDSPFTDTSTYWIERSIGQRAVSLVGDAPGAGSVSTFYDTARFEQDVVGRPAVAAQPTEDYWFWKGFIAGNPALASQDFGFDLPDVSASLDSARLQIDVYGFNNPGSCVNHSAYLAVNGEPLGQIVWAGVGAHSESLLIDSGLLREGDNTLAIMAESGAFFVDGFEVSYRREMRTVDERLMLNADGNARITVGGFSDPDVQVWDVSDPLGPIVVEAIRLHGAQGQRMVTFLAASPDARYAVSAQAWEPAVVPARPNTLRDRDNAARYLVIAPEELAQAAQLLADYRAGKYSTRVVTVQSIMDAFNYGNHDPVAIREFLRYAASEWALPPEYVVLAGKGSYDYRDLQGYGGNLVPVMMTPTLSSGLVPSDNAFADFDGDGIPEMKVGRLPVLSADELLDAVSKLARRETALTDDGAWADRVLMVADDADKAGDFPADSDAFAALFPDGSVQKVQLNVTHEFAAARSAIADALAAGVGLMNYVGHGGFDRFAVEGLLTSGDLATLQSSVELPFVTAFTCNMGLHAFPGFVSFGENLVISPNNGATAVLAPTGLSLNNNATAFGRHVMEQWRDPSRTTIGDVTIQAMRDYMNAGGTVEVLKVFSILGDPASPKAN